MIFAEPNKDGRFVPLENGSSGPRLGFLGAFEAAYQATAKAQTMYGVEVALRDAEQEQMRKLRAAGIQPPAALNEIDYGPLVPGMTGMDAKPYGAVARGFGPEASEEEAMALGPLLAERNAKLHALREQYPDLGIQTYGELMEGVRRRAQKAETKWNDSTTSVGGMVGGFLGAAAAGMNPQLSPLSAVTAPLNLGASIGGRIAAQGIIQGGVSVVEQFGGVEQARANLGLPQESAWGNVAMAAAGGAAFQGVGEAIGAAGRRWFRSTPTDPAPPPPETLQLPKPPEQLLLEYKPQRASPLEDFDSFMVGVNQTRSPLGPTRLAKERTVLDVDYAVRQLDNFDGPAPWEIAPATAATERPYPTHVVFDQPYTKMVERAESVDDLARRQDPELFRVVDKAAQQLEQARAYLDEVQPQVREKADAEVARLEAEFNRTPPEEWPALEAQLAKVRADQQALQAGGDVPFTKAIRDKAVKIDEELRDLAPLITRAYKAATQEWRDGGMPAEAWQFLKQLDNLRTRFRPDAPLLAPGEAPARAAPPAPISRAGRVPMTAERSPTADALPAKADAADRVAAVVQDRTKATEEVLERFREAAQRVIAEKAAATPPGERAMSIVIGGRDIPLDARLVTEDDGEITVRQYLKSIADDEAELKVAATCSVRS